MTAQPSTNTATQPALAEALPIAQVASATPEIANDNAVPNPLAPAADDTSAADALPVADVAADTATDAARKQVPPIEAAEATAPAVDASTEAQNQSAQADALVMSSAEREAMQAVVSDPKHTSQLVVFPNVFKAAEQHLAQYIGSKISPALTQELKLDLKVETGDDRTGHTKSDLVLYLQGDLVDANSALIESQVLNALKELPNIAPLFNTEHKPRASNNADYPNTLHIIIPNLAIAQYAHLMQSLAAGIEVPKAAHAQSHSKISAHPAAELASQVQANAGAAMDGHLPATEVAAVNHEGVANDQALGAAPAAVGR